MSSVTDVGTVEPDRVTRRSMRKPRPDRKPRGGAFLGVIAWIVGIIFILPILWMLLTSFHSEADAGANPPATSSGSAAPRSSPGSNRLSTILKVQAYAEALLSCPRGTRLADEC